MYMLYLRIDYANKISVVLLYSLIQGLFGVNKTMNSVNVCHSVEFIFMPCSQSAQTITKTSQ